MTPACDIQFENNPEHLRVTFDKKILCSLTPACDIQFENNPGHPRPTVNKKIFLAPKCLRVTFNLKILLDTGMGQ